MSLEDIKTAYKAHEEARKAANDAFDTLTAVANGAIRQWTATARSAAKHHIGETVTVQLDPTHQMEVVIVDIECAASGLGAVAILAGERDMSTLMYRVAYRNEDGRLSSFRVMESAILITG